MEINLKQFLVQEASGRASEYLQMASQCDAKSRTKKDPQEARRLGDRAKCFRRRAVNSNDRSERYKTLEHLE